jgi:hypothetical protein
MDGANCGVTPSLSPSLGDAGRGRGFPAVVEAERVVRVSKDKECGLNAH